MPSSRVITALVEGQQISGWSSGSIESSMIQAADSFVLRMPFSLSAWNSLRLDAKIKIAVDGTVILNGFIDKRQYQGLAGMLEVSGRDKVGRACDESAPAINYTGMSLLEAVRRLLSPWFEPSGVVLSNARNRRLRRGKGRRVASGNEPVVTVNVRVPRRGAVHPGETRWQMIKEILSRSGLIGYSSGDGDQFIIARPNYSQEPQYLFALTAPDSKMQSTVKDMTITEDAGDRYSMYLVAGAGGQGDLGAPSSPDNRGVVFDNPFNRIDGTGRDFIHPKKMFLPERSFSSYNDAQSVAELERARRDYKRHCVSIEAWDLGQYLTPGELTLFSPDTVARVINEEMGLDDTYGVVECHYNFSRDTGDWTTLHLVPTGTEIVL